MTNILRIVLATIFAPVLPLFLVFYGFTSDVLFTAVLAAYTLYFLFGIPLIFTLRKGDNLRILPIAIGGFLLCVVIGVFLEFIVDQPSNMTWDGTILIVDGSRTVQGYLYSLRAIVFTGLIGSIVGITWWLIGVAGTKSS